MVLEIFVGSLGCLFFFFSLLFEFHFYFWQTLRSLTLQALCTSGIQDPSHPPLGPPAAPKSPSHVSGRPFTSPSPLTPHAPLTIRRRQPFSLRCEGRTTKSFIRMLMDGQKQRTEEGRKNKRKRKERKKERFD